jgi:Uma2 family endonuclease
MDEYILNGVRLGWLIDPSTRRVWVYTPDTAAVEINSPRTLAGDPVLPGFVLNLEPIWD